MKVLRVYVAVVLLEAAVLVAGAKQTKVKKAKEEEGRRQGKVRYVPYFKRKAKGSGEVIQFYRAIYPADYSDLSKYKAKEVKEMAALAEGPEHAPVYVELEEDAYFGRSRECRETTLLDQELAGECAWADLKHLGLRRMTLYTAWNSFVYIYRVLMLVTVTYVLYKLYKALGPLRRSLLMPFKNPRLSNMAVMTILNSAITDSIPGVHTEGRDTTRWNPEQMEVLQRLRLKAYYNFLSLMWNRRY